MVPCNCSFNSLYDALDFRMSISILLLMLCIPSKTAFKVVEISVRIVMVLLFSVG